MKKELTQALLEQAISTTFEKDGLYYMGNPKTNLICTGCNNSVDVPEELIMEENCSLINPGEFTFKDDSKLKKFVFSEHILHIPSDILRNKRNLTQVVLPKDCREIGDFTFKRSVRLKDITFGNDLIAIGNESFSCTGIENLTLPDSLADILPGAFYACDKLLTARLGASTKILGDCAFKNCYKLNKIALNEGLERIGNQAFSFTDIREIELPSTVKEIGQQVFAGTYIQKIYATQEVADLLLKFNPLLTKTCEIEIIKKDLDFFLKQGKTLKEVNEAFQNSEEER